MLPGRTGGTGGAAAVPGVRVAGNLADLRGQVLTSAAAGISSTTFVFSPVATTVLAGEIVGSRAKHVYERLTSVIAVKNGTTESTYLAETLIPLVAFGLPLSPVAAGPAAPLFNAPPVYGVDEATGQVHNLHTLVPTWQFLVFGLVGVALAAVVAEFGEDAGSG